MRTLRALRSWIRQDEADWGERDDRPTTEMIEENRRLRAENKELRRVNEVLRGASAYFAQKIGPTRKSVVNFVNVHDFSIDLVLRVLSIPPVDLPRWCKARTEPSRPAAMAVQNLPVYWAGSLTAGVAPCWFR